MPCFLIILFSFSHLWSQEGSKKTPSEQKKSENKQKHAPSLTINGAKIDIVPVKKTSEQQQAESKKEQVSTKNGMRSYKRWKIMKALKKDEVENVVNDEIDESEIPMN